MVTIIKNNNINQLQSYYPLYRNNRADLSTVNQAYPVNNFPKIPLATLKAYTLAFASNTAVHAERPHDSQIGSKYIENVIKSVKGKQFQGLSLYIPEGKTEPTARLQWSKIKWSNLKQEPLIWETAKKEDVLAFWHALSLCETQETSWVNRYNPLNHEAPRATINSIILPEREHEALLRKLNEKIKDKKADFLSKPLINPETGKFNVDLTVFDTETTGLDYDDRIIQIGAVKIYAENKRRSNYNKYFDPEMEVPQEAVDIHGLTREKLLNEHEAKPIEQDLRNFYNKFAKHSVLVAYNAKFDIGKLNYEIDQFNEHCPSAHGSLKERERCLVLDPFLMVQRIHPFLGAKKKLESQYRFLFCKDMEGHSHDAFNDVNATMDILKYCALYLNKHFTPTKTKKALTVADLLTFQFGGKVNGLDIELNNFHIDDRKKFDPSYQNNAIHADNFPDKFVLNDSNLQNLKDKYTDQIGEENIRMLEKLKDKEGMLNKSKKKKGYSRVTLKRAFYSREYRLKPHNGNSVNEIIDLIFENIPNRKNDFIKTSWMKNVNPWDEGNDLPDMEISRQVMLNKPVKEIEALNDENERIYPDLSSQEDFGYYAKFKAKN